MTNPNKKIKIIKTVLRDDVKRYLKERIMTGDLKSGERIVETRLAKEIGVSQAPVREAIRELELIGLVENQPYKGTVVKEMSVKEISDAYKVRAYIEGLAAKEAVKNITESDIEYLESLFNKMEEAATNNEKEQFVDYDIEFHNKIIELSNNGSAKRLYKFVNLSGWTFITAKLLNKSIIKLANRHRPVIECLDKKDGEGAEKAIREHVLEVLDELLKSFNDK